MLSDWLVDRAGPPAYLRASVIEAIRYEELAPKAPEGPVDLSSLIAGDGPLELDIGFGRGRSFLERAVIAPSSRVLGIELKAKWAAKVEERRIERGFANARVLWGSAPIILAAATPDGCLSRVFVSFPDPWWKKRHAKRRVLSPSLLDSIARLLSEGGELFVQTDVEDRAQEYLRLLTDHPRFEPAAGESFSIEANPFGARSNREVRAEADGIPIFRMLARRC